MFYSASYNNGVCGLSWNFNRHPVSIYGSVTNEEEAKEFLRRCEEQLKYYVGKHKNQPSYWVYNVPNTTDWVVSFQLPVSGYYGEGKYVYKDNIEEVKLVYSKPTDSYTLQKTFTKPLPLDIYKNPEKDRNVLTDVSAFGSTLPSFLAVLEGQRGRKYNPSLKATGIGVASCANKAAPYIATLHFLGHMGTQAILEHIRTNCDVLFEKDWHNPVYTEEKCTTAGSVDGKAYDPHDLKTLIFQDKVK